MCINKQTSFAAWIIALCIGIFLWQRNTGYDRWNSMFIITFSAIQLLEAGLWISIDSNKSTSTLTKIVLVALWLQPFIQSFAGYLSLKSEKPNSFAANILLGMSLVFAGIILWALGRTISGKEDFFSVRGPGGHMVWTSTENGEYYAGGGLLSKNIGLLGILYLLGLLVPLLFMTPINKGLILIATGLLTFAWARSISECNEFGSMWCLIAIAYAGVSLVI